MSSYSIWIIVERRSGSKGVKADEGDSHIGPQRFSVLGSKVFVFCIFFSFFSMACIHALAELEILGLVLGM